MKISLIFAVISAFTFNHLSFADTAQGTGAAGTAGALQSGTINGPSGHESGPNIQENGPTRDGSNRSKSDTNTTLGDPSSRYRGNGNNSKASATETGVSGK